MVDSIGIQVRRSHQVIHVGKTWEQVAVAGMEGMIAVEVSPEFLTKLREKREKQGVFVEYGAVLDGPLMIWVDDPSAMPQLLEAMDG